MAPDTSFRDIFSRVIEFLKNSDFCPQDGCRYNGVQSKLAKAEENFSFAFGPLSRVFMLIDLPALYLYDLAGS